MGFSNGISQVFDPLRLRLLVEVQRRGSIAAAADTCGIGQPSATKHLKTLEAAAGQALITRSGRGSELTDAGRVVSARAVRMLANLSAMEQELSALRDGQIGELSIAASTAAGTYVLPSVLACFAERHPGVDVTVSIGPSERVVERVARREVHLGLAGEMRAPDGVVAEPFLDDELVGIAAAGERCADRLTVGDLRERTLLMREAGSSTRGTTERYLGRLGFTPTKFWELGSNEAIKRAVAAGLGVAFLSRLAVDEELTRGELVRLHVDGLEAMRRPVQLLRNDDGELTPAQQAFLTTLADCCTTSVAGHIQR